MKLSRVILPLLLTTSVLLTIAAFVPQALPSQSLTSVLQRQKAPRTLLGAATAGEGTPQPPKEVTLLKDLRNLRDLKVVDMHQHFGSFEDMGELGKKHLTEEIPVLPDFLKKFLLKTSSKFTAAPYGSFLGMKQQNGFARIDVGVMLSVYAPKTWGIASQESLIKHLEDPRNIRDGHPQFVGFSGVNMTDWDNSKEIAIANLSKTLEHPLVVGIKLAFIHNNFALDDRRYDPIYQTAAKYGVPVYHHIGSTPLQKLSDKTEAEREKFRRTYLVEFLEPAIQRYQNVTFILGHMGFDFNDEGDDRLPEVIEMAERYPNVLLEISAFGSCKFDQCGSYLDWVFQKVKQKGVLDRVVYGSDMSGLPLVYALYKRGVIKSMKRVNYTVAEAEQVMSKNLIRHFKIDPLKPFPHKET
ncbi:unnamed protein product [Vitrella brassicaformis CCMP3155]|uniref:Amidohydrolase-related domain-containing protein n=1 Tax=Vitrella brassicaformis (strain CCMP3155) TaxID=1169540 RepID=A0A0G4H0F1_VITBC|nr:unnamed protein product [Vitrella brassicaformis CCMP3155]|eukprot:CEM37017.1 unnamed protein product [Vitrella brassicaformis CCMP3155]